MSNRNTLNKKDISVITKGFEKLADGIRKKVKSKGIKKIDVKEAIRWARK